MPSTDSVPPNTNRYLKEYQLADLFSTWHHNISNQGSSLTRATCLFLLWGRPFMTGDGPKMVHFGPKWPNMTGLSTLQSGSKGFKRDQNGQPKCFWPFGTLLGPSGLFWTISIKNCFFASMHLQSSSKPYFVLFGATNSFLSEMVKMGPKMCEKGRQLWYWHMAWSKILFQFLTTEKRAWINAVCLCWPLLFQIPNYFLNTQSQLSPGITLAEQGHRFVFSNGEFYMIKKV